MYDIRQFRPTLYLVILLGLFGFGAVSDVPGLVLIAGLLVVANAWLVHSGHFRPMPHWMANVMTLGALLLVINQLASSGEMQVLLIGQFLVFLQLVKLYEHRGNRDDAQLLVLSLLLMMAAGVSTFRVEFAMLLGVYLLLALYCAMLFHLKVETDRALAAISLPQLRLSPGMLRQDRRFLARSMRRLTGLTMGVSVFVAAITFIYVPRGRGSPWLRAAPSQALTGFSDRVSFENIARITQSSSVIGHVQVWHNGQPVSGRNTLLLRGLTLDTYGGNQGTAQVPARTWIRSPDHHASIFRALPRERQQFNVPDSPDQWHQHIQLFPTGTETLFAMSGMYLFVAGRTIDLNYVPDDQTLVARRPPRSVFEYDVYSSGRLWSTPQGDWAQFTKDPSRWQPGATLTSIIDPRITQLARRPEVSGSDDRGSLAAQRVPTSRPQAIDALIARHIERYLRDNYRYTLDLTGVRDRDSGNDPLVDFLYTFKQGHCEYFAGAMTLMCQSLGLEARMVVGFKCDEYSDMAEYYVVRQSQAHAWVEVNTPTGWRSFDPTSSIQSEQVEANTTWLKSAHLLDYLEYQWGALVIGYDETTQQALVGKINQRVRGAMASVNRWAAHVWQSGRGYAHKLSSRVVELVLPVLGAGALMSGVWLAAQRVRLRRRAERIGLESMPAWQRAALARQLGFYDELLRLLEHRGIRRARHQTPREFGESLAFLPSEAYTLVGRLTELFYRVRFGGQRLHASQQRRLHLLVQRIQTMMGPLPD